MAGANIVYNHFPRLAGIMRLSVADVVHETTEAIFDESQSHVPVREGALKDSGRTDYSADGLKGIVGYDDFKAIWNEYGTGAPAPSRAEPFLTPAAEHQRGKFDSAVRSIEPRLRTRIGTRG